MSETVPLIARWIWSDAASRRVPNQYVEFRLEFDHHSFPERAMLRISADTDFAVWINEAFAGCGQFTDFPERRTYSELDIESLLRAGRNVAAIRVHYCGEDHFSYLPGDAGLWCELEIDGEIVAVSDERILCRASQGYQSSDTVRIDGQRGFTFHFDATTEDQWTSVDFPGGKAWARATASPNQARPQARPVKMLKIHRPPPSSIVAQGLLKRLKVAGASVAQVMQQDFLSARRSWEIFEGFAPNSYLAPMPVKIDSARLEGADGMYIVIDLGREECGFPAIEIDASDRCVIDIAIGEHLDDLRVRSHIGGRNFASRYVARQGNQKFVHYLDRYAGRYVQLHITELRGELKLHYAGLIPAEYPVKLAGAFESGDSLSNQIWHTARRTLHLCMFEHYEDCPWREQALYANDSRNQMLAGYYAFGEYEFARVSLELLAQSTGDDGYQELCAPMKCPITIPSFTMTWFLAMNDYLMYSGDREFIRSQMPRMKRMLEVFLSALKDNLLPCPTGTRYWHMYDWAPGLDGTDDNDCRKFHSVEGVRFDAPLNLFLILALQAVANMATYTGDAELNDKCLAHAIKMRAAAHQTFWNDQAGAYQTYRGEGKPVHLAELTQSLAILAGVGDPPLHRALRSRLMAEDTGWVATTLSQSFYKFEAILLDPNCGSFVYERINRDWSRMLFAGATSFWETLSGGWDFNHAGSLCHGWSGTPVYFYGAYGLGIKPLTPGFATISTKPVLPMMKLSGVVPTPRGDIPLPQVACSKTGGPRPEVPEGVTISDLT